MNYNKDFYDKIYLASAIKFVSSDINYNSIQDNYFQFITSISTVLARNNEVVAVYIEHPDNNKSLIHLSKNGIWTDKDKIYIKNILNKLVEISKISDTTKNKRMVADSDQSKEITNMAINYCAKKIDKRINKLKNDFDKMHLYELNNKDFDRLNLLKKYIKNSYKEIITRCTIFYKEDKKNKLKNKYRSNDNKIFKHILKIASYANSINTIITCANDNKYKNFFNTVNIDNIKYYEPINSKINIKNWKKVLQEYIPEETKRNIVIKQCLDDLKINNRLIKIYGNKSIYYHGELYIIKNLVDRNIKKKCYIGVSKLCCFMCYQFINYLNKIGFQFIIQGTHGKLYNRWMMPLLKNNKLNIEIKEKLYNTVNNIIINELDKYTDFDPDSDSVGGSIESGDIIEVLGYN